MDSIRTQIVTEGKTRLVVPDQIEPMKYPSFFNPRGKFVRDVSIICYNAFVNSLNGRADNQGGLSFADSLSGTGARGIRVANELPGFFKTVFLNDISPTSIDLARRSSEQNGVEKFCKFTQEETCSFLSTRSSSSGERFDVVDVDPFGTPSPFIDCALRAVKHGGLLSVSATDTAVLCGVYPKVAQRKYLGLPIRTDYSHEIGFRLIFGLLSMTAMRIESSIRPVFCHHDMHYFRAYAIVEIGNAYSRQNETDIGYVLHCFKCGSRRMVSRDKFGLDANLKCPECAADSVKIAGPLWSGKIQSKEFVSMCAKINDLRIFEEEMDLPLYYDLSDMSDTLQVRTPKIDDVIKELRSTGHSTSRTRLNPKAIRTEAPLQEIRAVLVRLSR
jgi:tRNA (guanine26-N2/guanine27-N2)-dimethyltransferase